MLPQRDLPIWARFVAIVLFLFASWWLFDTDSIRNIVGDSIGALCLGVIAVSILQGMHLPLGLWPAGPWRKQFSVPAVVGTAIVLAALILMAKTAGPDALAAQANPGTLVTVVVGTVALTFGVGFVQQRRSLIWYAIALVLGVLPLLFELVFRFSALSTEVARVCYFAVPRSGSGGGAVSCTAALVPTFVSLAAIGTAAAIVTEEIAFRRLLIGMTPGAGILPVLGSTLTALCWYAILFASGFGSVAIVVYGALGALSAACVYVLSQSLMASALFSGVLMAGYRALALATEPSNFESTARVGSAPAAWIVMSVVGALLAFSVVRQNGIFGNLRETTESDATRS